MRLNRLNLVNLYNSGAESFWTPQITIGGELPNFWSKERVGSSLIDSIGNNDSLILNNYWSKRLFPNGMGIYYDTDHSFDVKNTGCTIGMWFKVESVVRANTGWGLYHLFGKFYWDGNYTLLCIGNTGKVSFGTDRVDYNGSGWCASNDDIQDLNWHFVLVRIDNVAKTMSLNVDGVLQNLIANYVGDWSLFGDNKNLTLAREANGADHKAPISVGDIYWYNRCLNDVEALNLYNNVSVSNCFAHWVPISLPNGSNVMADIEGLRHIATEYSGLEKGVYGSLSGINGGFSRYSKSYVPDLDIPKSNSGSDVYVPATYTKVYSDTGNTNNLNRYDCMIRMVGSMWDRSNTTIWNSLARAGYYDASNPKDWHSSELIQIRLFEWANTDYRGCFFVKYTASLQNYGTPLLELFSYNTKKTGNDLTKILTYCNGLNYSDLLINGVFSSAYQYPWSFVWEGWEAEGWSVVNGKTHFNAICPTTGTGVIRQITPVDLIIGKRYRLKYTISNCSGQTPIWFSGNGCGYFDDGYYGTQLRGNGSYDETLVCTGTEHPSWFELQASGNTLGGLPFDISNLSLELLDIDDIAPLLPTNLALTLISGGVKIDWTDKNAATSETEIYGKSDNGTYSLLYTIAAGTVTKSEAVTPVDLRYYKIRAKRDGLFSEYTAEVSIAMLGAENVTNGTFDSGAGWSAPDGGWSIANGVATHTNDVISALITAGVNLTEGKTYKISWDVNKVTGSEGTQNTMLVYSNAGLQIFGDVFRNTDGHYTANITCLHSTTNFLQINGYNLVNGCTSYTLDNISIKEILMP